MWLRSNAKDERRVQFGSYELNCMTSIIEIDCVEYDIFAFVEWSPPLIEDTFFFVCATRYLYDTNGIRHDMAAIHRTIKLVRLCDDFASRQPAHPND